MVFLSSCGPSINSSARRLCALRERRNEMRCSNNIQNRAFYGGLILTLVGLIATTVLLLKASRTVSAQTGAPSWSGTGNLNSPRARHTATVLSSGKVLVAGGDDGT